MSLPSISEKSERVRSAKPKKYIIDCLNLAINHITTGRPKTLTETKVLEPKLKY